MEKFKIKPLTKNQIIISVDRLTRFKETETKYLRVFKDVITGCMIMPKYRKSDLDEMDYKKLKDIAEYIINKSLGELGMVLDEDYSINQKLYNYETSVFDLATNTQDLLKNKIHYKSIVKLVEENSPINLKWLKSLKNSDEKEHNGLRFPIKKVILAEGITEEILLPKFARLCGYDFDKNGVFVISAGGKNQVVKYFYRLVQNLKLPIFVLFDNDAKDNLEEIKPKLREIDQVHIIECGEFEDLLPITLIKKTLNNTLKNFYKTSEEDLQQDLPNTKILEEFFKHHGLHEFKKAEFAQSIKENIESAEDVSDEIRNIINEIKSTTKNKKGTGVPL